MATAPVRQCAILVGGLGTRLGELTAAAPKPLLPVAGKPFLWWLLREVSRYGISDVILLTGHMSEVVEAALPALVASLPRRIKVTVSREPVRAGTGGAVYHAAEHLHDRFLLLNGDSLLDQSLGELLSTPVEPGVLGCLMLRQVTDASRYGAVTLTGNTVTAFAARPEPGKPGIINGGVYLLEKSIIDHAGPQCSLEQVILPALAAAGSLRGVLAEGWFIDIGIPADLARAQIELPRALERRALFLDRDGVCNVDHGWVGSRDRFEWVSGARETIAAATHAGWHVFVVTNQSGVARGHYTEADVCDLLDWMRDEVMQIGGTIDDYRYCPFHPEATLPAYRKSSDWRKPGPGMLLDLMRAWNVAPERCLMIGDQSSDMEAAAGAGIAGHLFPGANLADFALPLLHGAPR